MSPLPSGPPSSTSSTTVNVTPVWPLWTKKPKWAHIVLFALWCCFIIWYTSTKPSIFYRGFVNHTVTVVVFVPICVVSSLFSIDLLLRYRSRIVLEIMDRRPCLSMWWLLLLIEVLIISLCLVTRIVIVALEVSLIITLNKSSFVESVVRYSSMDGDMISLFFPLWIELIFFKQLVKHVFLVMCHLHDLLSGSITYLRVPPQRHTRSGLMIPILRPCC